MEELKRKVNELIEQYSVKENDESIEKLKKLFLIKKLLENSKCFFEMPMEQSISILRDLEVDDVLEYYKKLISQDNWNLHIANK